jgi:hypothetical protein
MDDPTGRAASEDVVSRAVRMLISPKTAAHIACSNSECKSGMRVSADPECGSALRICMESLCVGGSTGRWTPNHHVDELFVRANCAQVSLQNEEILALLVGHGAVVLGAQQVITAGLEHDMFGTGFKAALKSLTHHECNTCAAGPGKSLRLRLDARTLFNTEVKLVAGAIHDVVSDDPKVRLRCGVQCENRCCGESINSGALLTPPCAALKQKSKTQASAMGTVPSVRVLDPRNTYKHGQLLYFSRNTGKPSEVGVIIWVVDQRLPVVQVHDFLELFAKGVSNYNFTPLNTFCDKHNFTFPRSCGICAKTILSPEGSQVVEFINGPVHTRCSQKCEGCGLPVARLGPTPKQATVSEQKVALPAKCFRCANPPSSKEREKTVCTLARATVGDKPGKPSTVMVRDAAMLSLKRKAEGVGVVKGGFQKREERWIGDFKEGLWPGDCGIFRMADDTIAFKENKDGVISRKPVCGAPFREACGGVSVWEWGVRVSYEEP